jgi:hypothetical protein
LTKETDLWRRGGLIISKESLDVGVVDALGLQERDLLIMWRMAHSIVVEEAPRNREAVFGGGFRRSFLCLLSWCLCRGRIDF